MNSILYFMTTFAFRIAASQTFTYIPPTSPELSLTLRCVTVDLEDTIAFKLGNDNKGVCFSGGSCSTGIHDYEQPIQRDGTITEMVITSCNKTRDAGSWTCAYGGLTSDPFVIVDCSEETTTTAHIVSTNTTTDNYNGDGKAIGIGIGILTGILVITYIIVIVMVAKRLSIRSIVETSGNCFLTFCQFIEEKFFDCCGNKNNQENPIEECLSPTTTTHVVVEGDPDFFADKVLTCNSLLGFVYLVVYGLFVGAIVLSAVYYGYSNFQEGLVIGVGLAILFVLSCLCLVVVWILMKFVTNDASETFRSQSCIRNGTVTPHETRKSQKKSTFDIRQQPDGDEGPQSTPKDPDARHITTIDILDEQKTDKKPKDKKKKKKKMKDEEQDNPAYDTEQ